MGLFSGIGDLLGGGKSMPLNEIADQSFVNVQTPGASAVYNPDTNTVTSALDPRHQQFQNQLFGLGSGLLNQFNQGNFQQEAQDQYNLLSQLGAPQRDLQRQSLENRLYSQGLLGATAGQNQMTALNDAFGQQDVRRQIAAQQLAQNQRDTMFNQGLQSLNGIQTLDQIGAVPVQLGSNIGSTRADLLTKQRNNSTDTGSGLFSGLLNQGMSLMSGGGSGGSSIFGQLGGLFGGGGSAAAGGSAFDMGFGGMGGSADMLGTGGSFFSGGSAGAGAGTGAGSGSMLSSAGPVGAIAAAVAASKELEARNSDNFIGTLGQTFNAPSIAQIKEDPMVGVTTALGVPFINSFIMNDKAKKAKPFWDKLFDIF